MGSGARDPYGVLKTISILILVVRIHGAGPLSLVCFTPLQPYPRPLPLPPTARLSSCSHFSSACRGSCSVPLCRQSICLPRPAFCSFPSSSSSSFWESCRTLCGWDEGEAALLRKGGTGQRPWFSSPGQANCRLGCGEGKV